MRPSGTVRRPFLYVGTRHRQTTIHRTDSGRSRATVRREVFYVSEVATMLGIGRSTAYELVSRGEITAIRVGQRLLVTRTEMERLLGYSPAA